MKLSNEPEVKNLWMCLNYDQKPTIKHVTDHIKQNFCTLNKNEEITECKLYLDNFWLPLYEDSKLIRENDCIKVEVNYDLASKPDDKEKRIEALTTLNQNVLNHIKETEEKRIKEKQIEMEKLQYDSFRQTKGLSPEEIATVEAATYAARNNEYFSQLYQNNMNKDITDSYENWLNNKPQETFAPVEFTQKSKKTTKTVEKITEPKKTMKPLNQKVTKEQPKINGNKSPTKDVSNYYRNFSVGSYAQMLNEPVQSPKYITKKSNGEAKKIEQIDTDNLSEEQVIDRYFEKVVKKNSKAVKSNQNSEEFAKISAGVNQHGKQKWKNSTQQTKSNGSKHIIFKSSSSDSSSTSSSESESEQILQSSTKKTETIIKPKTTITQNSNKQSKFYEPSKTEQLDAVSYNRSYLIKNTKNLNDFKKTFNEGKLNAPQAEQFADISEYPLKNTKKNTKKIEKLNSSTSSRSSSSSSISDNIKSPKNSRKSPLRDLVNYDEYQSLLGSPRLNDKIAFQILEISSNFTPEISAYKTGTVIELNETTNEITLEMNNKYNHVLKKPSKFTVILDETDKEELHDEEPIKQETDNILKVDWRNLMNLKLCPTEQQLIKELQIAEFDKNHIRVLV